MVDDGRIYRIMVAICGNPSTRSSKKKKEDKDAKQEPADAQEDDPDKPKLSQNVLIAQKRMQQTQAQVDEVTEIMKANVEKVLERDAMLSQLDERADALKEGAEMFEKQAGALKSKYWWKNLKMMIVCGVAGLVMLFVIYRWLQ